MDYVNAHSCSDSDNAWVVLEKVHGANFSYFCDGTFVQVGKRTSFITSEEYETFYKCKGVAEKYAEHIRKLFRICATEFNAKQIAVYGELFGGNYPGHKSDVPVIQKGVHYIPFHGFYVFDLCVDKKYLNYDTAVKLFKQVGLVYARVLYRGSLKKALDWSNDHKADPTTIPAYFSLPDVSGNRMEGHVLKPVEPAYFPTGSAVVIKNKNPAFAETNVRAHRAQKPVTVEPELQKAIDTAVYYVTKQRYDNVVSKIGIVTKKDVGKLIGLLSKDALEDYNKEHMSELKKEQVKALNKTMNIEARKIVLEAMN